MSVYVQIGAGAGDRDSRLEFRDGFTEHVKSLDKESVSRILLVEPNPLNIKDLMECWKDYPQAEIYNIGICPIRHTQKGAYFFYAEEDAPNYQTTSVFTTKLKQTYGENAKIKRFFVGCLNINEFNALFINPEEKVSLYSLDIEGLDADVLLDLDFSLVNPEYLSFEWIHLGGQEKHVLHKMKENNYIFDGVGVDVSMFDWLFRRSDVAGLV